MIPDDVIQVCKPRAFSGLRHADKGSGSIAGLDESKERPSSPVAAIVIKLRYDLVLKITVGIIIGSRIQLTLGDLITAADLAPEQAKNNPIIKRLGMDNC